MTSIRASNGDFVTADQEPERAPARQRWALTKGAFDKLLASLDSETDKAGEKYLLIRRNLVRFFEGRGCPSAEDHADEAINRIAKRLYEGEEIRDFHSYSYGVARLLLLEIIKEREREERALKELPSLQLVQAGDQDLDNSASRLDCLNCCLREIAPDSRELILQYYQGDKRVRIENRKRLAESLGIPGQALRSRAVRLREKLETCILTCQEGRISPGGPGKAGPTE